MDPIFLNTVTPSDPGPWISTFSGKRFYFYADKPEICLEDIAHSLSMLCRFTGHCKSFWSVGQHSVLVAAICSMIYESMGRLERKDLDDQGLGEIALSKIGLLHDSTEAYVGDMNSPLKSKMGDYRFLEDRIFTNVCEKFDLPVLKVPPLVKYADAYALRIEFENLMDPDPTWTLVVKNDKIHANANAVFKKLQKMDLEASEHEFLRAFAMLEVAEASERGDVSVRQR